MKLLRSFGYAWRGLVVALREQLNLRIHFMALTLVVTAGIWFQITATEWVIITLTAALVISLELVNSSIENLTNLVTREHHPLAGKVKDIAAAAVLIAAIGALVAGIAIFAKYFLRLFSG